MILDRELFALYYCLRKGLVIALLPIEIVV